MATQILGVYQITYENGISQTKNLISHDDYLNIIIPTQDFIYELERKNKFKETKESKQLKNGLKNSFGSLWFTDQSPLYYAMLTNILTLPPAQGGEHKCFLKKIE